MSNTILTSDVIVRESLAYISDAVKAIPLVNRSYEGEFTSGVKKGTAIRVKRPVSFETNEFTGLGSLVVQNIEETSLTISVDKHFDVSFGVDSSDWTFTIEDFAAKYLNPAMDSLVKKMETYLLESMFIGTQDYVSGISGYPSSIADLAKINGKADELNIPSGQAQALVGTKTKTSMLSTISQLFQAEQRADNGSTLRTADIGVAYDVKYYSSNLVDKVAATFVASTYTTGATVKTAASKYDSSVILENGTSGEIIAKGQMLEATNTDGSKVSFKAKENATFNVSGEATVQVVVLKGDLDVGAEVEKVSVGNNFLFHKNAVSFIAVAPSLPMGGDMKAVMNDSESGIGLRIVAIYNGGAKADTLSIDVYCGAKVIDERLIAQF